MLLEIPQGEGGYKGLPLSSGLLVVEALQYNKEGFIDQEGTVTQVVV
jgi:hypothetical protein